MNIWYGMRLRAPAILLGGWCVALSAVQLGAQAGAAAAPAQVSPSVTQSLLDKARAFEQRGRLDLATQTWQQVLLADPNNPDALGGLARAAKLDGNTALANTYLERLRATNPNDPNIARVETLGTQQNQMAQLQQAGKLAESGQYAAAMAIYRQVFGATPPPGDWSLAYYETESATEDGRPHSIAGLRALVEKYPSDSRYQIALGRILTYNPKTREEGRKYLEKYPKDPQAVEAYRQSLLWDSPNPAMAGKIKEYLATHHDPQLQAAIEGMKAQVKENAAEAKAEAKAQPRVPSKPPTPAVAASRARAAAIVAAYKALNAKHVDDAEAKFKAVLADDPENAKALAGMGYVRMQQGNFSGAISFLEQAKHDDSKDKGLAAALETSRFYFILGEGQAALSANDLTAAEKQYRTALGLRPTSPEATEGLAGTLVKAQQPAAAVPLFQAFVKQRPAAPEGWRGLFTAQVQAGDVAGAMATEKAIPPAVQTELMKDPLFLQTLAAAYSSAGRDADAQKVLEAALALPYGADAKPVQADLQMQYAAILFAANKLDQAAGLYRQALAANHDNTAAWQGLVRVLHAMGNDAEAMQTVESMPPASYAVAMKDAGFETTVASAYQAQGKLDVAQDLIEKAIAQETTAGQKPAAAIQMQLAGIYMQRGQSQLAYPIYQRVLTDAPDRADAWAGLLSVLHTTGHDKEAVSQVELIPPAVRSQLEMRIDYLDTMASVYGSLGESRQAAVYLARVEQYYAAQHTAPPAQIEIQNAYLLYNGVDDAGLYRQLMTLGGRGDLTEEQRRTVQAIWTNWAVRRANQAAAAGDTRRSLAILNAAARSFPDNPAVLRALAGGYAKAGEPNEAVLIFKAQNMSSASVADYQSAVGSALAAGDAKDAEAWLRYALAAYPGEPQILILAAKFEQSRGDTTRAMDYYRKSLAAMPKQDAGSQLAEQLNLPAPATTNRLPSNEQQQDLSNLLAPGAGDGGGAGQPYLPSYTNYGGSPYGQSPAAPAMQPGMPVPVSPAPAVPPYMSNPIPATGSGAGRYGPQSRVVRAQNLPSLAEVELRVREGIAEALGADAGVEVAEAVPVGSEVQTAEVSTPQTYQRQQVARLTQQAGSEAPPTAIAASPSEPFGEYVPYVAPVAAAPEKSAVAAVADADYHGPVPTAVPVQLGDATPHPSLPQAEVTDVLPTAKYMPNARATTMTSSHPDIAAAQAAEIRRRQSDPASTGPLQGSAGAEVASASTQNAQYTTELFAQNVAQNQVPQPPSQPSGQGGVPDSGEQQYPQPRGSAPATPGTTTKRRVVRRTPAPAPVEAAPAPAAAAPVQAAPVAAQPMAPPYPPIGPAYPVQPPPTDAELMARNLPPLRGRAGEAVLPLSPRQQAEDELASLEGSYSGWVGGTGIARYRSGTPGLDRFYDLEAPVEFSAVLGHAVRLTVVPREVFLNSGTLNTSPFAAYAPVNVPYLGTLPASAVNPPAQQLSNGLGGELQLTTKNLGLAAGYTPYEFLVRNITGRFRWRPAGGHFTLFAERDSVKDTQLSYAGLRDPGTVSPTYSGTIWGGVVSTTGGVRFDAGSGGSGFYLSGDGGVLRGDHVLDNTKVEGSMGAYFRVKDFPGYGSLTVGAALFGMHYAYNELGLTYGQGGYFSPNDYFLAAVPVTFSGYYQKAFHYTISGAVGVQTFQQDAAPFFPLDPGLQSSVQTTLACTIPQLAAHNCGQYPVSGNTGFNYAVNSEVSYRFREHWYLGGFFSGNNTNNYNSVSGGFFFRYTFRKQREADGSPTGLFPVDGFRPLQVP